MVVAYEHPCCLEAPVRSCLPMSIRFRCIRAVALSLGSWSKVPIGGLKLLCRLFFEEEEHLDRIMAYNGNPK
jgi:hypothetical protein